MTTPLIPDQSLDITPFRSWQHQVNTLTWPWPHLTRNFWSFAAAFSTRHYRKDRSYL